MSSSLEQLRSFTTIVADTGDFSLIEKFRPQDCTTNPSLLLRAAKIPAFKPLVEDAIHFSKEKSNNPSERMDWLLDKLAVNIGLEILKLIPGRVSTEVDASLSFNAQAMIDRARRLINLYEDAKIPRDRVLIKLATTWEGCVACKQLEYEGIHCNMTLIFSLCQAVAAAEAGATLISPFVGRILDWHLKATGKPTIPFPEDPGVLSVQTIYNYFKEHGYKTVVMGASFRNAGEVRELAGCDLLTVSPQLLEKLAEEKEPVTLKLSPELAKGKSVPTIATDEISFRWQLNEDAMATEKLSEGIRMFWKDTLALIEFVKGMMKEEV